MKTAGLAILLGSCLFVLCGALSAQIQNNYAFTQSSAPWEPVWGNYATDAMVDEGITYALDIGFTFPYGSYEYTQVKISSNGWLNLGANLTLPYYGNDMSYLNIRPVVAPLWDDISLENGAVQYVVYGSAPHRVFFVQWLAARWNYNSMNEFSFMVRLHETGQIDLIYGPHIGMPNNASASIGINMTPGGSGYYYSVLPGAPAQAFTTTSHNNIQTPIPQGTMYIFMPRTAHPANAAAVNLNGTQTPMQNVVWHYTATVGNAGSSTIQAGAATAYLMRGSEVLASAELPAILPGNFAEANLSWAPDTIGLMYLTAKVELANDADSLNNETYPLTITAQEFVSNDDATTPTAPLQLSVQPNPFRNSVSILYNVPKTGVVKLEIYNLKGQKIAALVNDKKAQGSYTVVWDGTDSAGKPVPSGVYICNISSSGESETAKLLKLK